MFKNIYLFFLIICFFFVSVSLIFKYNKFDYLNKKIKYEASKTQEDKEKENSIFWYFIFGLFIFYMVFYLSKYFVKIFKKITA